jgi:hypothetical protein
MTTDGSGSTPVRLDRKPAEQFAAHSLGHSNSPQGCQAVNSELID